MLNKLMLARRILGLIILVFMLSLTSCSKQKSASHTALIQKHIPIFISIPKNPLIFDNIAPLFYDQLHQHYLRIGYHITDHPSGCYHLDISLKRLQPREKLVSQNLQLFHTHIQLEVECRLLGVSQEVISKKKFFFSGLLSKPKNPNMNSDFLDFEYKKLFRRSSTIIEQYFRRHIMSTSAT